jgi:hypothetical protein
MPANGFAYEALDRYRALEAAQETFPDQDIQEIMGGWLSVPKGTPVVQSTTLDGLVRKLRENQDTATK